MQRDSTITAVAITAATAAASALSFFALTTAAKSDELATMKRMKQRIADVNGKQEDSEATQTTEEDANESNHSASIMKQRERNRRSNRPSAEDTASPSIRTVLSTETGYTAEQDDKVPDLADPKDIYGSGSFESDHDSDSDISYDDSSFRGSLKDFFQTEMSDKGIVFDSESVHTISAGSDHIFVGSRMNSNNSNITNSSNHLDLNQEKSCIYLDYNGTTPIDRRVFAAMIPYLTLHFGNPSSSHAYGAAPKRAINKARRSILDLLHPNNTTELDDTYVNDAIVFTGCGTEANNMAIQLAIHSTKTTNIKKKPHIVTTNVEHPAIAECLKVLQTKNEIDVTYVPVNEEGIVSATDVSNAITDHTILVTVMLANNESGALQPVKEIAEDCHQRGILFHTDAAQAVGKVSIALDERGISSSVDMVTIVGHKFGAPKGIACLYIRPGCLVEHGRTEPTVFGYGSSGMLLQGGGQERGRRAGTENVPYIVGMGHAAEILASFTSKRKHKRWRKNASKMRSIRTRLLFQFKDAFQYIDPEIVRENGPADPTKRLPNTLSIGFKNVNSAELLKNVQSVVACSAGSACHASGGKISGVLVAMKVPPEYARGTLRLSVGPSTRLDEVDKAAKIIIDEIKRQLKI